MGFWRKELIDFALDYETQRHMDEQIAWIGREPANPRPYYHLAQFFRMSGRTEGALGLLLEAVRLDPQFADAHAALTEMYAVAGDTDAAWRHARLAEENGNRSAVALLERYPRP